MFTYEKIANLHMNITTQFLDSSESFLSNYSFQDNIPDVLLEGFWLNSMVICFLYSVCSLGSKTLFIVKLS